MKKYLYKIFTTLRLSTRFWCRNRCEISVDYLARSVLFKNVFSRKEEIG